MTFTISELKKLFDYLLTNRSIILTDTGFFSRDTLIHIREIVKNQRPNDLEITPKQVRKLITSFLSSNMSFNEDTPEIILQHPACIEEAINRCIYSVDYIENFTPELTQKALNLAVERNYILNSNSPKFLKSDISVIKNSIKENPSSVDFIDWDSLSKEDYDFLIQEVLNSDYILTSNSCNALRSNPKVVLKSIAQDINTINFATSHAKNNPAVFKYLITHNHKFNRRDLEEQPLISFADPDIMKHALNKFDLFDKRESDFQEIFENVPGFEEHEDEVMEAYINRVSALYARVLSNPPTIKSFEAVFQYDAEDEWLEYREENLDNYNNIFGKICVELQANDDFDDAINELDFLSLMKDVLDEKYNLLMQAMSQYHSLFHSNIPLGNFDFARDRIAEYSALYVSKSKEKFKKDKLDNSYESLRDYFIPRRSNSYIRKRIIEHKQKEKLKKLYNDSDKDITSFIDGIIKKYSANIDETIITNMIIGFVIDGYSKLDSFIKAPHGFNNYKRYLEAKKLVNRLNSKYIKYEDNEVFHYMDIIKYDINTDKYYYTGPTFDEDDILRFERYKKYQIVFDKIKQEIIYRAKSLEVDQEITDDELNRMAHELPFTDEFFEFDIKYYEENITFETFMERCLVTDDYIEPASIFDDDAYEAIIKYLSQNSLLWLCMFAENDYDIEETNKENLLGYMDNMYDIVRLSQIFDYNLNEYKDVVTLAVLSDCADEEAIAILGKDIITSLINNTGYVSSDPDEVIDAAKELVSKMVQRDKSTVPYVSGKTLNYEYSMYDSQDISFLLAGINTDACFKIGGNDNDFFHYCAIDKNGFVIKITDTFGNFIARASGFRNGNCVFINQLRTIYDEGGEGYEGSYKKEKEEIIEAFKKACEKIVETSQNNPEETDKIDFVFVTKSYAMQSTESNVNRDVERKIGSYPMDTESDDWKEFVRDTENLTDNVDGGFTTDSSNYDLICMASSKGYRFFSRIRPKDIKPKDVKPVYTRSRNKIISTDIIDQNVIDRINRINGIYSYLSGEDYVPIDIPKGSVVCIGDNWYIVSLNGEISSQVVLDFDARAVVEYVATSNVIEEIYTKENKQVATGVIDIPEEYYKKLTLVRTSPTEEE